MWEDCSGATKQYDDFVTKHGVDKDTRAFDAGDAAATIASMFNLGGVFKHLTEKLLKGGGEIAGAGGSAASKALASAGAAQEPPVTLYGPFHRKGSKTATPEQAGMIAESSELWGRIPRWGGEPTAQAHRGPIPPDAPPGSVEFYTTVRPKPTNRTPNGYVSWELGVESGVRGFMKDGEEWASIPIIVTEVRK
ncbi:hypothetical protein [Streptomyces melanogenes]|uniref:hypothetical protein n=1 Tax=Streptomyces melanogenes TaxID=67326 RepID=UPI00167EBDD3|nr:hypothetical protein [Streptomyces melanogenes]GGP91984.1 hypothetical protein GCM10010278_82630 [Streptomyces melanogenes]